MTALRPRVLKSYRGAFRVCCSFLVFFGVHQSAWAQPPGILTLKNGARLGPGVRGGTATISRNSMQRGQAENNAIALVDDDLRVATIF